MTVRSPRHRPRRQCSFCHTYADEQRVVISGPSVFICEDCVWAAAYILAEGVPPERLDGRPMIPGDLGG